MKKKNLRICRFGNMPYMSAHLPTLGINSHSVTYWISTDDFRRQPASLTFSMCANVNIVAVYRVNRED
jgi:hypothetical protein